MVSLTKLAGLLLIAGGCAGGLILTEAALRVLPTRYKHDTYRHGPDPVLGHWGLPDQIASQGSTCFRIFGITSNSHGMRDRPRSVRKQGFRVAFFGDSMIEGQQVADEAVVTRVLEGARPDIEFLNFAASGFSPVQEWLSYREKARQFDPDVVVVCIWPFNDIPDGSYAFRSRVGGNADQVPSYRVEAGDLHLIAPEPHVLMAEWEGGAFVRVFGPTVGGWLVRSAFPSTYRLYSHLRGMLLYSLASRSITSADRIRDPGDWGRLNYMNVYRPPVSEEWKDAWRILEHVLLEFRRDVEADGAEFLVVAVPAARIQYEMPNEYRDRLGVEELPTGFDPEYPIKRLRAFASEHRVRFLSLVEPFQAYVQETGLEFPYFSYTCDGHWSPLGHAYAAEVIEGFLVRQGLTPSR